MIRKKLWLRVWGFLIATSLFASSPILVIAESTQEQVEIVQQASEPAEEASEPAEEASEPVVEVISEPEPEPVPAPEPMAEPEPEQNTENPSNTEPESSSPSSESSEPSESNAREQSAEDTSSDTSAENKTSSDESKTDESTSDESKTDESTPDESKPEESTSDESKTDESKEDESTPDKPKTDESKVDESTSDESKADESKADTTDTDKTKTDESKKEDTKSDKSESGKSENDKSESKEDNSKQKDTSDDAGPVSDKKTTKKESEKTDTAKETKDNEKTGPVADKTAAETVKKQESSASNNGGNASAANTVISTINADTDTDTDDNYNALRNYSYSSYSSSFSTNTNILDKIKPSKKFTRIKDVKNVVLKDTKMYEATLASESEDNIVAELSKDALVHVIKEINSTWVFVETRDKDNNIARGYVLKEDLEEYENQKENKKLVTVLKKKNDNNAFYITNTTTYGNLVRETNTSASREELIKYSMQFLGNPYVWGGESLTNGCDCSGFTMLIYKEFGMELPRCSYEQAEVGTKIDAKDALPGDLLFYERGGTVYHVLIYIGDGKAINASSSTTGIIISNVDYNKTCWGVRMIDDTNSTQASTLVEAGKKANEGDEEAQKEVIEVLAKAAQDEWSAYGLLPSVVIAQAIETSDWASFDNAEDGGIQPEDNNVLALNAALESEEWESPWAGNSSVRNVSEDKEEIVIPEKSKEDTGADNSSEDVSINKEETAVKEENKEEKTEAVESKKTKEEETKKSDKSEESQKTETETKTEEVKKEKETETKTEETVETEETTEKDTDENEKSVSNEEESGEEIADESEAEIAYEEKNIRTYEDIETCFADYAAYQTSMHPEITDEMDVDTVIDIGLDKYTNDTEYKEEIKEIIDEYDLTQYDTQSGEYAKDETNYTQEELELIWAIIAQEDDTCYEGALAVISSAMNRADANYGGYGTTALEQLTADGQYCYSPKVSDPSLYQRRLEGNVPEFVIQAVSDCLTQGIRNNTYLNFRSSNRTGKYVQIGGNWYF